MLLCSAGGGGQRVIEKAGRALACGDVHLQHRLVCKHIVQPDCAAALLTASVSRRSERPERRGCFPPHGAHQIWMHVGRGPHHSGTLTPSQHGRPANQRTDITAYIWSCAATPALCCARIRLCVAGGASLQTGAAVTGECTVKSVHINTRDETSPPLCSFNCTGSRVSTSIYLLLFSPLFVYLIHSFIYSKIVSN